MKTTFTTKTYPGPNTTTTIVTEWDTNATSYGIVEAANIHMFAVRAIEPKSPHIIAIGQ